MEIRQANLSNTIRKLYQHIFPDRWRDKLYNIPLMRGIRESLPASEEDALPYVLLQDIHIANTKVVANRNALLSQLPKGGVVAEVGVNEGDFSRRILTYAQPSKLHLIDVWSSDRYHEGLMYVVQNKFATEIAKKVVQIHRGYSTTVLPQFEDHTFDWVYIDTDHTYATTSAELEICAKKVKPGGIIAGHDYITGDWKLRVRYGVVEAVNEFCVKHGWEIAYLTNETHRHVSFALRQL